MSKKQPDYISYLLRVWRSNGGEKDWRASLQNPHTGECMGFAGIDDLCIFLRQQTGAECGSEDNVEPTRPDNHQNRGTR
ncbi:MAG: hypothetical protein AB8I69_19155 [Anaerolineae bacterium]|jgi:hypothetical protein